jgi:hypothetical protein
MIKLSNREANQMDELKVIMQDVEDVYHQLGAVLRDLDMILSDMDVDTDPPDEYNVFEDEKGHACTASVDGG